MTWKEVDLNLASRRASSLSNMISTEDFSAPNSIIISENDLGVIRNGGRRGAEFGPQAILSQLKKMANHDVIKDLSIISAASRSMHDFDKMQNQSIAKISKVQSDRIVHLGGGHDHIYPLVKGLALKKPLLINIDAHLDTRADKIHHSGTPFRQLSKEIEMTLLQIGIHEYANVVENYQDLEMEVITMDKLKDLSKSFTELNFMNEYYQHDGDIVFSIDADAIAAADMASVSAVNHDGIPLEFLRKMINQYQENTKDKKQVMGIYEYNPALDDNSVKDARALASIIYSYFK